MLRVLNGQRNDKNMNEWKEKDVSDIIDWLQEIIDNPEEWKQYYSDSEVKLLAEKAKELINISRC